jgi:protein-disulfide isomerase-like protein with CxxC motif
MNSQATLYHVHDPMCSWCWGFRKVWDQLRAALPSAVTVVNVVGGLAPDSNQAMPLEQRRNINVYSFPSLVLSKDDEFTHIDINYQSHAPCLDAITALL